jgi:hypothetical protein
MTSTIRNWSEYDAGLKQKGSLTFWINPSVLEKHRTWRKLPLGVEESTSRTVAMVVDS